MISLSRVFSDYITISQINKYSFRWISFMGRTMRKLTKFFLIQHGLHSLDTVCFTERIGENQKPKPEFGVSTNSFAASGADGRFHLPQPIHSHRLVDNIPDGIRRFPLHPLGGMGIGVQRESRRVVAQRIGEGLHIHAVLEGQCGKGVPLWHNKDTSESP